jgi:hypothetical protein
MCALTLTGFTALTTNPAYAASSDVQILSYSWYVAPSNEMAAYQGDLVCVGEIENVGTTNLLAVNVLGTAYVNDTAVAYASRQIFGNNLKPGQKAPFYLDFVPQNSETGDQSWVENVTNVFVGAGYSETTDEEMYQGLTVSSQDQTNSGVYQVIGSVTNTGSETIGDVRVVTTFYNANGTVVSLNYTEVLSASLAPGSSENFVATPVDNYPADNITSYATLVQSTIELPDTSPTATTTPTPTPTSTLTSTPTSTPTETPDQGIQDYTLIIIGVIALVAVVLFVVVLLTRKGKRTETPTAQ